MSQLDRLKIIGANALDGYHLATQFLTLYADIIKREKNSEAQVLWAHNEDSLLTDVGDAYQFWTNLISESNYGLITPESKEIDDSILSLKKRFDQIFIIIENGAPVNKMPSLLMKCEKRWYRVLEIYKSLYPPQHIILSKLIDKSNIRIMNVSKLARIHGQKIIDVKRVMESTSVEVEMSPSKKQSDLIEEEIC